MSVGQHLHLRLFLEGVEVPVISANISSPKNAPAAASIQIPANDYALDLRPRTLVHLFFKDLYHGAPPDEQVSVRGPGIRIQDRNNGVDPDLQGLFPPERFESTPEQDITDLENDNYKLCFGGEIIGFQSSKTPSMRSIVLQCLDWTNYWDIAYQYQVSGFSLGGGGIRAAFTGASTTVFNSFLDGSADIVVNNMMATPPRSYPKLRGSLLGSLVHILEAIGGTYFGRNAVRGVNDFFSVAELRLHLTQMVGANPFQGNDELRLLRARGFGSLFRRSLSGLGKLVSIRAVLLALQKYIFHEHIPIVTPRFIPPISDPNVPQFQEVGILQDENTAPIGRIATRIKQRAEEMKERQQASTTEEAAIRQSRRRGGLQREIAQISNLCDRAARLARLVGLQEGQFRDFVSIPEISRAFAVAGSFFNNVLVATRRGQRPGIRQHTFYAPDSRSGLLVLSLLDRISREMQRVLDSKHRKKVPTRGSQPDPPPRLLTTVYRPDVWMVAPPRCNVIFPELYSQFTYGRNFNQEVSRLLLRTHSAFLGSDILFDGWFMSPSRLLGIRSNRRLGRGRIGQDPDVADAPAWVVRDLMDHELFTGIIPTFERMSDLNLHALRGRWAEIDGVRMPYAQLAANHIFFQYRFKSRQLVCSGKFNPYIAHGFPCVIIDKYLSEDHLRTGEYDEAIAAKLVDAIREGEGEAVMPPAEREQIAEASAAQVSELTNDIVAKRPNTHYLGTPEMISHSISAQGGGNTQIQMSYARTTNERSEFFGDNLARTRSVNRTRNQRAPLVVAMFEEPIIGSRGPRGGQIVDFEDVTDRHTRRQPRLRATDRTPTGQIRYRGGTRLPLFVPSRSFTLARTRRQQRRGTQVLVGVEQPAASYGDEVVALVGTAGRTQTAVADAREILVTFRAYRITEEIGVYSQGFAEIPPEKLTFPPWYGDSYRSANIGGLYSYFFGTGAITDPLSVVAEGENAARVAQRFDGSTLGGEEPAVDRTLELAIIEEFSAAAEAGANSAPVSDADQPPVPGLSQALGEAIGPPGEQVTDPVVDDILAAREFLAEVQARSPIATALEEVVRAYSQVKVNHFDVHQFIRSYTWRPIATMVDLFGTANLEISDEGEVLRGREGFHSRAFGDFDDLRQLVGPGSGNRPQTILGLTTRDPDEGGDSDRAARDQRIAARMDTRKEKRLPVFRYLHALMASNGILG